MRNGSASGGRRVGWHGAARCSALVCLVLLAVGSMSGCQPNPEPSPTPTPSPDRSPKPAPAPVPEPQ